MNPSDRCHDKRTTNHLKSYATLDLTFAGSRSGPRTAGPLTMDLYSSLSLKTELAPNTCSLKMLTENKMFSHKQCFWDSLEFRKYLARFNFYFELIAKNRNATVTSSRSDGQASSLTLTHSRTNWLTAWNWQLGGFLRLYSRFRLLFFYFNVYLPPKRTTDLSMIDDSSGMVRCVYSAISRVNRMV